MKYTKITLSFLFLMIFCFGFMQAEKNMDAGQKNTATENQNISLTNQGENQQNQVENTFQKKEIKAGDILERNGKQIKIEAKNKEEIKLMAGNSSANCKNCNLSEEIIDGEKKLMARMSNGNKAEIKIMPDTASQRALERLRLKNCNESNNCTIELKEVGNQEQTKMAYELKAQKKSKFLGLFPADMEVETQIDAETGEIIKAKKPWWAFLASEEEETPEETE